jgi:hypothetical protein
VDRLCRLAAAILLAVAMGLGVPSGSAWADDESSPVQSVSATLTLRLSGGKSTYFVGETIPLELEFCGRAAADYYFSTSDIRRRPRGYERFLATPEEVVEDPLHDDFTSFGFAGSILSSWHPLDGRPFVLRAELNEWVRFTRPGAYRVSVVSRRLERYSRAPAPTLTSNTIELEILESPAGWAQSQLARALTGLDAGNADERRRALRELQYLDTREAARELVRRYGEGGDELQPDWRSALMASRFRREMVSAMDARVDAGDPLPAGFIGDLASLRALLDVGPGAALAGARFEVELATRCAAARRWVERLDRRPSMPALAAAMTSGEDSKECPTGLAGLLGRHPALAREALASLPSDRQAILLKYGWAAIGGNWAVPAIEEVYRRSTPGGGFLSAGDEALRRLAELDPARGRALAGEEIRSGAHGITADTLHALVPDPLPGMDDALVAR